MKWDFDNMDSRDWRQWQRETEKELELALFIRSLPFSYNRPGKIVPVLTGSKKTKKKKARK